MKKEPKKKRFSLKRIRKNRYYIYLGLAISILLLDLLVYRDIDYTYNRAYFLTWLGILIVAFVIAIVVLPESIKHKYVVILQQDFKIILFLLALAVFSRFIILSQYPYIAVGDEMREVGYNGLLIEKGITKNLFSFASYNGYGNFMVFFGYLIGLITDWSFLAFRLPAAIAGVGTVFFTYMLARLWKGKQIAIIATLMVISATMLLHFSRTEVVINSAPLMVPVLFLAIYHNYLKRRGYFLTGLIFGMSVLLYVGVRPFMVVLALILVVVHLTEIIRDIRSRKKLSKKFLNQATYLTTFLLGFLVGLGPVITISGFYKFSGAGQWVFDQPGFIQLVFSEKVIELFRLYQEAFSVYFYAGTTPGAAHFPVPNPVIDFPVNLLFIVGFSVLLVKKKKVFLTRAMLILLVIFPFLSQVLAYDIIQEQRLVGILIPVSLIAAYGLTKIGSAFIDNKLYYYGFLLFVSIYIVLLGFSGYFFGRMSDQAYPDTKEYRLQQALFYIKEGDENKDYYLVLDDWFDTLHHKEKIDYMTYKKDFELIEKEFITDEIIDNSQSVIVGTKPLNLDIDKSVKYIEYVCKDGYMNSLPCPINGESYEIVIYE